MFGAFDISTSALGAQRTRLDTIASNIANIDTTRRADGKPGPYQRLMTVFQTERLAKGGSGVRVAAIEEDPTPGDRGPEYPNVELSTEMVNAIEATRAYEANITAIETTKSMMAATLRVVG